MDVTDWLFGFMTGVGATLFLIFVWALTKAAKR
jgi:hypothetical protein